MRVYTKPLYAICTILTGALVGGVFFFVAVRASADTLFLKNGGRIEGVIEKEDNDAIELNIGFGTMTFHKNQITKISRSSPEESAAIIEKWEKKRKELKAQEAEFNEAREKRFRGAYEEWIKEAQVKKSKEGGEPRQVQFRRDMGTTSIAVEALINKSIKVNLILDTGASVVVLSHRVGRALGIDMADTKKDIVELRMANGQRVKMKSVILKNVSVQGVEVNDVMAAILLEDTKELGFTDGLLGMSFLNQFNMKIDLKSMRVTLEKIK